MAHTTQTLVRTSGGLVRGLVVRQDDVSGLVFKGIPYAAPPVGPLRWRAPEAPAPWEGVRDCTQDALSAPQALGKVQMDHPVPQGEDCLTVNVITPGTENPAGLPVMVWLHGGAFIHGNGNDAYINRPRLPSRGVVLVNVNMRLGPIGLLAHPQLSRETVHGASGNYMMLDIFAALRWVQANIGAFGGNPDNVTIFGESGGGTKVITAMCSPLGKGLFHRAIIESGGVFGTLNGTSLKQNEAFGEALFAQLGVAGAADPLEAARSVAWEDVIAADARLVRARDLDPFRWDLTIDGHVIADTTANLVTSGRIATVVPMLAGCNLGEIDGTGSPFITFPSLVPFYGKLFDALARDGAEGYAYLYDHVPRGWREAGCVSYHRLEAGYVFGDWDDSSGFFSSDAPLLAAISGAGKAAPALGPADRTVSELMMQAWTSFARDGRPILPAGMPPWPSYDQQRETYLLIVEKPEVRDRFTSLVDLAA